LHSPFGTEEDWEVRSRNRNIGSSLDDLLCEESILEEARAIAIKDAIAFQIQQTMKTENISKAEMARRMQTSRAALDRFLVPGNASITLHTLFRAARAVGRDLRIRFV